MSYRSIKRVLGETSLERKCRFLFGICLLALITASFSLHNWMTEELVRKQNRTTARLLADQAMLIEHWVALNNAQELMQQLADRFKKDNYGKQFISLDPADVKYAPRDDYEWKLLDAFPRTLPENADPAAPEFLERDMPDKNEYWYYRPVRVERNCVTGGCHLGVPGGNGIDSIGTASPLGPSFTRAGNVTPNNGDLAGILRVSMPSGPVQKQIDANRAILLTLAIVTVFLAMIGSYIIIRYVIVKPLRHLRDVSDAVSHGNTSLRADIHTGDEFEALSVAFNRMLHHLVTVQEELQQVNVDLDTKVDELAQLNMRLYEMNRLKSDFLATMSHELRTPLNSILGFSDVLRSIDALDDRQKRYVENIRKSGRVLLDMINDILDLAKIESGKMEVRLVDFPIEHLISALCDMARPLAEKKNIDVEMQVEAELPLLHQDQSRVQQILNNLLSNAIKFTPEGGRIKITARRDTEEQLVMQVIDTGVGIAEEDQQIIFEKFRQGHTAMPSGDAMTREHSGTGLGLSIVRELCRLLGGDVAVESTLGKGSTFTVRLPWHLEAVPRAEVPADGDLAEFSKARFDFPRDPGKPPLAATQPTP